MKKLNEISVQNYAKNERNRQKMEMINKNPKDAICEVIVRRFKPLKNGSKILASILNISHHSVNNWFYKKCSPDAEQLIALMASSDVIADEVLRLVAERKKIMENKANAMGNTRYRTF